MLYALICIDSLNSTELRTKVRPEHLAYLDTLGDSLKFAGPFVNDEDTSIGTLAMIEAATRADAETISANDPYEKAGLFSSVEIRAWKWALKNPGAK